MFGSFFGVAASVTCAKQSPRGKRLTTTAQHQLFVLISIILSFCLWPTVFAGTSSGEKKHRVIVNAVLSQSAAVVSSFAAASLLNPQNLFDVVCSLCDRDSCIAFLLARLTPVLPKESRANRSDGRSGRCVYGRRSYDLSSRRRLDRSIRSAARDLQLLALDGQCIWFFV